MTEGKDPRHHDARRGGAGSAQDVGIRERIAQNSLQDSTRAPQAESYQERQQNALNRCTDSACSWKSGELTYLYERSE